MCLWCRTAAMGFPAKPASDPAVRSLAAWSTLRDSPNVGPPVVLGRNDAGAVEDRLREAGANVKLITADIGLICCVPITLLAAASFKCSTISSISSGSSNRKVPRSELSVRSVVLTPVISVESSGNCLASARPFNCSSRPASREELPSSLCGVSTEMSSSSSNSSVGTTLRTALRAYSLVRQTGLPAKVNCFKAGKNCRESRSSQVSTLFPSASSTWSLSRLVRGERSFTWLKLT
mmetsp:Transcript_52169/g.138103  ORF Transcript_52169/g.138103 Transcript_52169/m.138103 type:complete len:235 (-) Transcript_52169:392-1096(-)